MNYFWVFTFLFAFFAMLRLIRQIEEKLMRLTKLQTIRYSFDPLGDRCYKIMPCPPDPMLLVNLSNVISVKADNQSLVVKAETLETVEDMVFTLNSGCHR